MSPSLFQLSRKFWNGKFTFQVITNLGSLGLQVALIDLLVTIMSHFLTVAQIKGKVFSRDEISHAQITVLAGNFLVAKLCLRKTT